MTAPTLPQGTDKRDAVEAMFDRIAPRYAVLNRVISFGLDQPWRRTATRALRLPPGSTVLDVACGTGEMCERLAAERYDALGLDLSAGMLARARTGAPLVRADALRLPVADGGVDGVTTAFALRNVVALPDLFAECARVLRRGGRLVALDTSRPTNPVVQLGHRLWTDRVVPFLAARLGSDPEAYRYLPRSSAYLPPAGELVGLVRAAGFGDVQRRALTGGVVQLLTGTRR